jgi:hypothetical protein
MTPIMLLIACLSAMSSTLLICIIFEFLLGLLVAMPSVKFCTAYFKWCASDLSGRSCA